MLGNTNFDYQVRAEGEKRSDALVLVLSHHTKPVFGSITFPCRTVDIWEARRSSYYTYRADIALNEIHHLISVSTKKIVLVGCSKAGYGALLWGMILAASYPRLGVVAIAFSPQSQVYPENRNIPFPSYRRLIERGKSNPKILSWLKKRGRLPVPASNFQGHVYFPDKMAADLREAKRLGRIPGMVLHPLRLSCHTTVLPFTADMTDQEVAENQVRALFNAAERDEDMKSYLHSVGFDALVAEYRALGKKPSLGQLVEKLLPPRRRTMIPLRQIASSVTHSCFTAMKTTYGKFKQNMG